MALIACGAVSDEQTSTSSEELDTNNPGVRIGNPLASTVFGWTWDEGGSAVDRCRNCQTTPSTVASTESGPIALDKTLADYEPTIDSWKPIGSDLRSSYRQAAALGDARLAAPGAFDNVASTLEDVRKDLQTICDFTGASGCEVTKSVESHKWTRTFPRVQGRHREAAYVRGADGFDRLETYPLPQGFAEQRMRGAKDFCAVRTAANEQRNTGAYLLDANDTGSWWKWTLGKRAASVKLIAPEKITDDPTSEAFMMPIALSSQLAPVSGPVFPDFGDLSHELVWVSGEREIRSVEDLGTVHQEGFCRSTPFGASCVPLNYTAYRNMMRNLEHVDVMAGVQNKGTVTLKNVVLVRYGFFDVTLNGHIDVMTGLPSAGGLAAGRVGAYSPFDFLAPRSAELDADPYAKTADAPLALNGNFIALGGSSPISSAIPTPATTTRWRNDDDRTLSVTDIVTEAVTISAHAGVSFGPVRVGIGADSTLDMTASQDVAIREQLGLVDGRTFVPPLLVAERNIPQTSLLFTPHSTFSATWIPLTFTLTFDLHLVIDIGIKSIPIDIHWEQKLFSIDDVPLVGPDGITSGELHRLRVGTYADAEGTPANGSGQMPKTYSHMPGRLDGFVSFPETVGACLKNAAKPADPPAPPPHVTPPGPLDGHVCAVGPTVFDPNLPAVGLPPDVCDNPLARDNYARQAAEQYSGNSTLSSIPPADHRADQINAERACLNNAIVYLCRAKTKRIGDTMSHLFSYTPEEAKTYGDIVNQCAGAFAMGASESDAKMVSETVAKTLMPLVPCSADATPD